MKILNCKAVSILICKKILADIPGSETFNLIPHLLRLEPSFGRSSVTNPQTDSRIIYNRLQQQKNKNKQAQLRAVVDRLDRLDITSE